MADEQGAQQVCSKTLSTPKGASNENAFFLIRERIEILKNLIVSPKHEDFAPGSHDIQNICVTFAVAKRNQRGISSSG